MSKVKFESKKDFIKKLSKYEDYKDVKIIIHPGGEIIEKTIVEGTWNDIEYRLEADASYDGVIMQFESGLYEFLRMIEDNDIQELKNNFYMIESDGGSVDVEKVEWKKPLNGEELKELEEYGGELELFYDGDVMEAECLFEWDINVIEVEINDLNYTLSIK